MLATVFAVAVLAIPLRVVAILLHEAGHAVAALLCGMTVISLWLGRDEGDCFSIGQWLFVSGDFSSLWRTAHVVLKGARRCRTFIFAAGPLVSFFVAVLALSGAIFSVGLLRYALFAFAFSNLLFTDPEGAEDVREY